MEWEKAIERESLREQTGERAEGHSAKVDISLFFSYQEERQPSQFVKNVWY